ncbi:MAG: hypothetical protein CMA10_04230 [Euryarchaeota archaeon]|nr:hypothetical protein [Euryarchaeota archaeon]|tara:strand:- start:100 stop:681 length:582 start_codon:yes stop_codon:yes gene_type:complete
MGKSFVATMCLFLLLSCTAQVSAADGTAGEDMNPSGDVPFVVNERTTPSQDGQSWELSISTDGDAAENGTTFSIKTQICLNSGICDPPVTHDITAKEGAYALSLTPPSDHTYVNWRVEATYADDSTETFPDGDWYKTWSTCFYDDGTYGGKHADGDKCDVPAAGESGLLPFLGIPMTAAVLGIATIAKKRKQN